MFTIRKLCTRPLNRIPIDRQIIDAVNKVSAYNQSVDVSNPCRPCIQRISRIEENARYTKADIEHLDSQIVELKYALSRVYVKLSVLQNK